MKMFRALALCLLAFLPLQSCSAVMGLTTGAFTGFVDLPSTLMADEKHQADDPDFIAGAAFLAPTGMVVGPIMGFFKGLALDYTWVTGRVDYGDVYGSYTNASVWRPYAWNWIEDDR